ncbi:MAG: sugar ABC transporter permease [Candidatus Atribacteria bacterium]|nr:sugar ABC transporter permease [Candidatus Atribacteria bacterium]MCD6350112.1 sugar ABC transporter permease [Candidatus Atribacteria bacterium]
MSALKFRRFLSRYWLLFPAIAFYIIFLFYPMVFSLVVSFYEWDGLSPTKTFVGLKNYVKFFSDPTSLLVLKNNLIWTVFTLSIPTLLGLTLAVMLNANIRAKVLFRSIFYSPAVLPLVAVGIVWSWIYNPMFGAINSFLKDIGLGSLARPWLADPRTALYSVIVTVIWQGTGFPMLLFLAGLQGIPKELYEAGSIDSASGWQAFWYITLPSLRETFVIVISLLIVNSLRVFDLLYIMTWGGPGKTTQVMGTWMYFNTFVYHRAGFGSAIAWIMTAISLIIVYPYIRVMSRK